MIENLKTLLLWMLIMSSVVLTVLIWTYQPQYDTLQNFSYFQSEEIGETRSASEVLFPQEILRHDGSVIRLVHNDQEIYQQIMAELSEIELDQFYPIATRHVPSVDRYFSGFELVFDQGMPSEWIKELFSMNVDFPMEVIDRIYLVENSTTSGSEVTIRFLSVEEEELYEASTSWSESRLNVFLEDVERDALTRVEKRVFNSRSDSDFQYIQYVTTEEMRLRRYTYEIKELPLAEFTQMLFIDPDYVKQSLLQDRGILYTDGNRMMMIKDNSMLMEYIRPYTRQAEAGQDLPTILQSSIDFVNSHYGWTDEYYVNNWAEIQSKETISYRMHVSGIPVLDGNMVSDYYLMNLGRSGRDINEYDRPIFTLEEEPFETDVSVELPPFSQVESQIQQIENYSIDRVEDIRIGYYMNLQRSFAIFEPAWFIKQRGRWIQLRIDGETDQEATNGLE